MICATQHDLKKKKEKGGEHGVDTGIRGIDSGLLGERGGTLGVSQDR